MARSNIRFTTDGKILCDNVSNTEDSISSRLPFIDDTTNTVICNELRENASGISVDFSVGAEISYEKTITSTSNKLYITGEAVFSHEVFDVNQRLYFKYFDVTINNNNNVDVTCSIYVNWGGTRSSFLPYFTIQANSSVTKSLGPHVVLSFSADNYVSAKIDKSFDYSAIGAKTTFSSGEPAVTNKTTYYKYVTGKRGSSGSINIGANMGNVAISSGSVSYNSSTGVASYVLPNDGDYNLNCNYIVEGEESEYPLTTYPLLKITLPDYFELEEEYNPIVRIINKSSSVTVKRSYIK